MPKIKSIEQYEVILTLTAHAQSIVAVGHGVNLIAFVLKEQYMCPEQVNLIVDPK